MECDLYKVSTQNVDIARYMPLDTALILVKALMTEYYNDPELDYTIKRERKVKSQKEEIRNFYYKKYSFSQEERKKKGDAAAGVCTHLSSLRIFTPAPAQTYEIN